MNKNINNHNGKEIHRDQVQKNVKKEGGTQSVDRDRKKNPGNRKETQPKEPRKAPISIHKNPTTVNQKAPNAQAVDWGNKDQTIHPVDSPVRKNQSQVVDQTSNSGKSFAKQAPAANTLGDNSQRYKSVEESPKDSSNTGKYLYIIAAILFIAWIIGFFFYKLDANIHMLLALAIIVGVISFLQGRKR
ncbi:MAG TPA: lmo0937 family membrane protein [Prolixibacteraceae bacterium]|nr:lmo0937 family membrane protein [Prolixibacteraceae bacterium]